MELAPNLDQYLLFILLVFPGMVAMRVYRMMMPASEVDWKDAIVQSIFFSTVNFACWLPIITWIGSNDFKTLNPNYFIFWIMFLLLPAPIITTLLFVKVIKSSLMKRLILPHVTAWDYFFDKRQHCFVIVHLNDGGIIAGYYGEDSFANSYPQKPDIYIQTVYEYNKQLRKFGNPIDSSNRIIIRSTDYSIIEFLRIPLVQSITKEKVDDSQSTSTAAGAATAGTASSRDCRVTTVTTTTTTTADGRAE